MINGSPLFTGTTDETQFDTIFRHMGTPDDSSFPGMSQLPEYRPNLPQHPSSSLAALVPKLDRAGVELLESMLMYDPLRRITAQEARQHPFFNSIPEPLRQLGNDLS